MYLKQSAPTDAPFEFFERWPCVFHVATLRSIFEEGAEGIPRVL